MKTPSLLRTTAAPATSLLALALLAAGCHRAEAHPSVAPEPTATRASHVPQKHLTAREGDDDNGSQEIIDRVHDLSPYAPDAAGLTQLVTDALAAAGRGDRAALGALLGATMPQHDYAGLALTFDGDRVMSPYVTGPAGGSLADRVGQLIAAAQQTHVTVAAATGAELASGAPASSALDPGMRAIASMLRPGVRFYRVTLDQPGTANHTVLECWFYAGGHWIYMPQPWRVAPGQPARATTTPSTPYAQDLPSP